MRGIQKVLLAIVATALILSLTFAAVGCDLVRKVQGVEFKFQKKVQEAAELSFDMDLTVTTADGTQQIAVGCYKKGEDYAYTFAKPDSSAEYRELYADGRLYEFVTKTDLGVGTYYVKEGVPCTDNGNLLYVVSQNILAATYATLVSKANKESWDGVDVYRYDFAYQGNDYSLWYDDANLVGIKAVFRSTDEAGTVSQETYEAKFANYRFANVDAKAFYRPDEVEGLYVESPISFESWMEILTKFGNRAASWL